MPPTVAAGAARPAPVRVVAAATAAMTLAVVPGFMTGATAVQMRADLHFGEGLLGLAVGLFFGAMSASSIQGGHLAERIGPRRGLIVSTVISTVALLLIAGATSSFAALLVWMVLGGISSGLALPAASLALVRGAPLRPGLMFGLTQSAPPGASLLAGIAVPAVSVELGWRWAYVMAAALALVVIALLPPSTAFAGPARGGPAAGTVRVSSIRREWIAVGAGVGLGSAAAISMGAFLVSSAVAHGIEPSTAGLLLAGGGAVGVTSRLLVGWRADHKDRGHLLVVAGMLVVGAGGYQVLAVGRSLPVVGLATAIAFGFGYGWPGLLFFSTARLNPQAPGLAVGVVNAGATAGAALGPLGFGVLVSVTSFTVTWLTASALSVVAAVLVAVAARRIEYGRHDAPERGSVDPGTIDQSVAGASSPKNAR